MPRSICHPNLAAQESGSISPYPLLLSLPIAGEMARGHGSKPLMGSLKSLEFRRLRQFALNLLIDPSLGELRGHADGVLDGIGIGPAVADDARAFHAQQRCAAIFRVVHPLLEMPEGPAGKHVSYLRGKS